MKLKSLILGSAAALIAVTGARAADAVIAEPEPVEYVRVCDTFGTGFFYIPGTETCLRFDGYVRYQIGANSSSANGSDRWLKSSRARLNIDARSDTEWGVLRGFMRFQATWNAANQNGTGQGPVTAVGGLGTAPTGAAARVGLFNGGGDGNVSVDQAIIELGGLRMGYTESAWAASQNGGISNFGTSHSDFGLGYSYNQRQQIGYTFSGGNGFTGTISLEDDGNNNYVPDIVAKAVLSQGWGGLWAKVGYDEDISTGAVLPAAAAANLSGLSGWAAHVGGHLNIPNMAGSSFRAGYYYMSRAGMAYGSATGGAGTVAAGGARHSAVVSYYHQLTSTLGGSVGFQYFWDTNFATAGNPNAYIIEGALVWVPVTNFEVRLEGNYGKATGASSVSQGFLRFTRYF